MDYQNTKIYKIESHMGSKIYIGSTTKERLSQRMANHRKDFKRWKDGLFHHNITSFRLFEEYGVENCNIVLLELYPCNSKDEQSAREAHWIKTLDCVNKVIPGRTRKQYAADNKAIIAKGVADYYQKHKEAILARNCEVNECECGKQYTKSHRMRHCKSKFHLKFIENKKEN